MRVNFSIFSALILQFFSLKCASTYNILVSTVAVAASQNLVMYRLADLLAERGHRVTVLKADVFEQVKTPKLKFVKDQISYTSNCYAPPSHIFVTPLYIPPYPPYLLYHVVHFFAHYLEISQKFREYLIFGHLAAFELWVTTGIVDAA
uniref:Uncharacterized protein n=1 Tax=Romanomermis culicivorax TaxID=13658 RepID=A0A915LD55_ROMCU